MPIYFLRLSYKYHPLQVLLVKVNKLSFVLWQLQGIYYEIIIVLSNLYQNVYISASLYAFKWPWLCLNDFR